MAVFERSQIDMVLALTPGDEVQILFLKAKKHPRYKNLSYSLAAYGRIELLDEEEIS